MQATIIFSVVVTTFGSPADTNKLYTGSCFQHWGRLGAMGISASEIRDLREDYELFNIFEAMKDNEDCMSEAKV